MKTAHDDTRRINIDIFKSSKAFFYQKKIPFICDINSYENSSYMFYYLFGHSVASYEHAGIKFSSRLKQPLTHKG
jgi:hypothetical protein